MKKIGLALPPIVGRLTLYDLLPGGKRGKKLMSDRNIVVTLGRIRVAELITGESSAYVTKMAVGDGFEGGHDVSLQRSRMA